MLCLQVELLTGRFIATDYADRQEAEWPPHPARLFSALVATWAEERRPDEREALVWLEEQPAPEIRASEASARDVPTVFVPVNDTPLSAGEALLPEQRGRQPRTFPSVTPVIPAVCFVWPTAEPTPPQRTALDALCARVHRLGHSSSLVSVRTGETMTLHDDLLRWLPHEDGAATLRVVQPGQLQSLEEGHALHQEVQPRVMPAAFQRYARADQLPAETAQRGTCFSQDWIVLRRIDGDLLPLRAAFALARAVRGAILRHGQQPPIEVISGHLSDGAPSPRDHLAVVPLPFVGRAHADGSLKGVALILPQDATEEERDAVSRAVAGWEEDARQGDHAESEHPPLPARMGRDGKVMLELADENLALTLRAERWCRPSRTWASVTPIALDRNPGELRRRPGRDPAEERARIDGVLARAEQTVREAILRVGLPEPAAVELRPSPQVQGSRPCRDFPGFLSGGHPRVLVHAWVRFDEPVAGPVLLGAGRYYGYGLMCPVEEGEP